MFLYKHPNGRYYIYYNLPNWKRKSKSTGCKLKSEAYEFLMEFKVQLKELENQKVIPITIREFQFKFFRFAESIYTEKTCKGFKTTFNFLIKHFGNIKLTEITRTELEEHFFKRLKETSIYAAARDYADCSSLFNKAIKDGYLLENPCKGIRKFKAPEKQPLFYSHEEFNLLINCIDNEDLRDITTFAVNTGCRQMELIQLEWRQVNFDEKIITLDNRTHITKGKKIRTVPLNLAAYPIMIKRKQNSASDYERVFTLNGKEIKQDYLTHKFKKYVIRSGVNPKLNFHSLRHTFASWLVQKGVSIYIVSKLLGHADIKTTQIYAHLRREDLRSATEQINTLNF